MSAKAYLNKAMLHTDTHKHTYTDTESALITSENTESENRKRCRTLPTPRTLPMRGLLCLFCFICFILYACMREFCRTVEIIARILREVVTRVRLRGHHTRGRSHGEVQSRVVVRRRGTKQNMDT